MINAGCIDYQLVVLWEVVRLPICSLTMGILMGRATIWEALQCIDYQLAVLWEVVRWVLAEVNTITEGFH